MKVFMSVVIAAAVVINVTVLAATPERGLQSGAQVVRQLKEGNARFVGGNMQFPRQDQNALSKTAKEQRPKATVLSCSDSRVPIEKIFDLGIGDLFVVRVAGNVCDVDETGTIEYGVDHLNTPVLVVLGHTKCGAVTAVATNATVHGSIPPLVENIKPAVARAQEKHPQLSGKELVPAAIVENVWQSVEDLIRRSSIVREKIVTGKLKILGGLYHLEDGRVEWLGTHPRQDYLVVNAGAPPANSDANFYTGAHPVWPDVSDVKGQEGVSKAEALSWLKDGNERFASQKQTFPNLDQKRFDEVQDGQQPFATVLTCSDSRLPAEEIFDAGIGDLFVVRVAGNVADVDETGSIEYGVGHLGTPLLVVMGHTSCGAVTAVATGAELPGSLPSLVDNITVAVGKVVKEDPKRSSKESIPEAIKANIWQSTEDLFVQSPEVCALVKAGKLAVEGALYHVENGSVEWLGGHPRQEELIRAQYSALSSPKEINHGSPSRSEHPADVAASASESTTKIEASRRTAAVTSSDPAEAGQTEDYSKLEVAVKALEANLKALNSLPTAGSEGSQTPATKQSSATREVSPSTPEKNRLAALNSDLEQLRTQVAQLALRLNERQLSESTLVSIMADIEFLKAENNSLKGQSEQTSRRLASLDDNTYTPSEGSSPQIDQLASLVTTLNESIEKQRTAASKPAINAPTVKHGAIQMTGFVHQQFYSKFGAQQKSTFDAKRARLGVTGEINTYAKIELVGEFAKTPKLLDASLSLSPAKNWNLRVGQYKIPFSTDVLRSSTAMPLINLSQAASLGPDRDIGLSVRYGTKITKGFGLDLYTGLFNGAGINSSDVNTEKNIVLRAEAKIGEMLTVSPNWYVGKTNDTGTSKQNFSTYGSSVTWAWKAEVFEAEYLGSKAGEVRKEGWYFWGGHTIETGATFMPEIQLVARYEQMDPSLAKADDKTNRFSFGTNLFIDKKYTLIQLNYQFNGEQGTSVNNDEFLVNFQVAF